MRERRKKQKEALLKKWTHANEHPSSNRIVLVVCATEDGPDTVWLGFYEDDGWYLIEGDAVFVKFWMELPLVPGQTLDSSLAT